MQTGRTGLAALTEAKLWNNPCWFAFRFNHIALRYNSPLYAWVQKNYGLTRPEFIVIYSLGLLDGVLARDISISSGFPKNTLSRAIEKLCRLELIERRADDADRRNQTLHLLPTGRKIFDEALPKFQQFEEKMLSSLSPRERDTLSHLLAKIVLDTEDWTTEIDG
ncbi:MarR family winged helix-turn-helix transcriptional regulator [Pelagibius sp. Alg239-R121]|uniref:MarR family winged helix-turn-helix transcriptional regulator n=1 Tax=Pelagibius sp. Alg239-R121 TaxID=2993448 RepID=UPI0024A74F01|nr:MarR family winged helix-turn-helix transcriptional regulator [Pelagibius sp. Alg239-R121]